MNKTLEDYQLEEQLRKESAKERELSDRFYAQKRIETVVDGWVKFSKHLLSLVAIGILTILGNIIIQYLKTRP